MESLKKLDELINLIEDLKKQFDKDSLDSFQIGKEIGIKEGLEEGKMSGEINERIEIATRMYQNKFSIDDIVKITKLSLNNVRTIIKWQTKKR